MSRPNKSSTSPSPSPTPRKAPTALLNYLPTALINKLTSTTNNNNNDDEIAPLFIAPRSYDEDDEDHDIEDITELARGYILEHNKPSGAGLGKSLSSSSSSSNSFFAKLSSFGAAPRSLCEANVRG